MWGIIDLVRRASTVEMKKRYGVIYVDLDETERAAESG
jgi:beta-glucosidase/6-phospho-beta-glucosidase/beta-galactosidase